MAYSTCPHYTGERHQYSVYNETELHKQAVRDLVTLLKYRLRMNVDVTSLDSNIRQ